MNRIVVWVSATAAVLLIGCGGPADPGTDPLDDLSEAPTLPGLVHELLFDDSSNLLKNSAPGAPDAEVAAGVPESHADRFGFPAKGVNLPEAPLTVTASERNHPTDAGLTIALWARLPNITSTAAEVLVSTTPSATPSAGGWHLQYRPGGLGSYAFRHSIDGGTDFQEYSLSVPEDVVAQWHFVSVVWDRMAGTVTIRVNADYELTDSITNDDYVATSSDLTIGVNGISYAFDGQLDQIRIFETPLSYDDPGAEIDLLRLFQEGKRIYYSSNTGSESAIYSSAIDGSDVTVFAEPAISGNGSLRDIVVRPDLGYVYWSNIASRTIERAPLAGGPVETVFDAGNSSNYLSFETIPLIQGIALNGDGTVLYTGDQNYDGILQVNLQSGSVSSVYLPVSQTPSNLTFADVDLDEETGTLYFLEEETIGVNVYRLGRIGTNGSNHQTMIENDEASGQLQPAGLDLDVHNDRAFIADRLGGTHEIDVASLTTSAVGSTSGAFGIGLSYSPSDAEIFYPRESAPTGDLQSVSVTDGTVTNYATVDAGYSLDLLVPKE